jgi:membrane fusion protein, copper/silver efflux system
MAAAKRCGARYAGAIAALSALLITGGCSRAGNPSGQRANDNASTPGQAAHRVLYYRHPMNPAVTSPAKDEMGMEYLPVYADESSSVQVVQLSAATLQKLAVRSAPVTVGALPNEIRAPGVVQFDGRSVTEAYVVTAGQVQNLSIRSVGESVQAGQLLFELYSPALATVDSQYLQALNPQTPAAENPYSNGLRTFGLTDDLIADLRDKRRSVGRIPTRTRNAGVVTALNVRNGAIVAQGASVLQWAATDPVWVLADVPVSQAADVKLQAASEVTTPALPSRTFQGRVDYIYPDVDPLTRALRVRVVLANRDGALKPNMAVSVTLRGHDSAAVLHVPREAVIRDGRSERVILALGEGRFMPREVRLGRESGDQVEVLDGLTATDHVVTSGLFLIDSESSIRSSLGRMADPDRGKPEGGAVPVAGNP